MCRDRFATHLYDTFVKLAADPEAQVRMQVAAQFHEVATILGSERCQQYMRRYVMTLHSCRGFGLNTGLEHT